jgi:steroid delta-isomerase
MTSRVTGHSHLFNEAVRSGSWDAFTATFTPDAVLRFEGVPAGPCEGRGAIAGFYAASPPATTMTVASVASAGDTDVVRFTWAAATAVAPCASGGKTARPLT